MHPAVLSTILLLVCALATVTEGRNHHSIEVECESYSDKPCGEGWSRIDESRCAKYNGSEKNFQEAQEHCRTLNSDLVSIHSLEEMSSVLCLTYHADSRHQLIWIGAKKSGENITRTDGTDGTNGTEFTYTVWDHETPDNKESEFCIQLDIFDEGNLNGTYCSEKKNYVCAKKM
ncbi:hepatic lectin-like [Micropterus dolomieu]|uniref:hepatic lectin-like n=1 Tax=Micropterus dolomieu TaxID=147949 RepID=UPI001E8CE5CA|nr:hepatic lectin-like [Micropterus dolomieu]